MSLAAYLANVLPAWIVAGSFVLLVYFVRGIMLELRAPRLAFATSPAMQAAPVSPAKPRIVRYDTIYIDPSQHGAGAAIYHAEKQGYTSIGKRGNMITMIKPNGRSMGQGNG